MSKILVGNVSPEGDRLIHIYLDKYMPDAVVEPLKAAGIKGKMKNTAKRPDVALVIIDEVLYSNCVGVADDVLSLPKVHRYIDDTGLKEFLISKFGRLDEAEDIISNDVDSNEVEEPTEHATDMDFGTSIGITDYSNDDGLALQSMREKLAQSEMLVHSLTKQLEESGKDSDVSALVQRIKVLEEEIEEKNRQIEEYETQSYASLGKVAKAEQSISELKGVKETLRKQKEQTADIEFQKNKLSEELDKTRKTLEEVSSYKGKYESLVVEKDSLDKEYKKTYALYESKCDEYTVLSEKYSESESRVEGVSKELEELQGELQTKAVLITSLENEIKDYKKQLSSLQEQVKRLKESEKSLQDTISRSDDSESKLKKRVADLESNEVKYKEEIESLSKGVSEKDTKISDLSSSIDSLNMGVERLTQEVSSKDTIISNLKASISEKDGKLEEVTEKLVGKSDEVINLESRLKSLSESVADLKDTNSELEGKSEEYERLSLELEQAKESVRVLEKEKEDAERSLELSELSLKNDLKERDRQITKLNEELEVLRRGEDKDGKTADLRLRIVELQEKIVSLENEKDDSEAEELSSLRKEVSKLKEENTSLNLDVAERDEQLAEISDSIFVQMLNNAMPKAVLNTLLRVPNEELKGMHIVAGGSSESNLYVYKVLKSTCVMNSDKKIIIVDLTTDSYIDAEFKVKRVNTPINWLLGVEPINSFVADTCFSGVKIVSTALAYINPLYLLSVDWERRLEDIRGIADIVIFHVGSLDNIISKIMFQSFARVMRSHVVVRATPINLRTVMLSLAGVGTTDNTEIACTNYDTASKQMFQKLAQKYKAKILSNTDGLGVG